MIALYMIIKSAIDCCVIVNGSRVKFKLKGNILDNLKEKCVDKAFQLLESKAFPEIRTGYVCFYNVDRNQWEKFEDLEFIKKFVKPNDG